MGDRTWPATNFGDANHVRQATAARAAVARTRAALEAVGDTAPPLQVEAGRLRVKHPHASLTDLAGMTRRPSSKDAIAGRLRRLWQLAEREDRP